MIRPIDTFFYGLYMDGEVLKDAGVTPRAPRKASAAGFALRVGKRATLVPVHGSTAWGMVYALTAAELVTLYGAPGLEAYQPQEIEVALENRAIIPARVYLLSQPPAPGERNPDYAERLREVLTRLGFPADYVAGIQ
jgi:gamma-glutamyl AIG2-like cyclotransferase